jgi:hypothetical protein
MGCGGVDCASEVLEATAIVVGGGHVIKQLGDRVDRCVGAGDPGLGDFRRSQEVLFPPSESRSIGTHLKSNGCYSQPFWREGRSSRNMTPR